MDDHSVDDVLQTTLQKTLAPHYFCTSGHVLGQDFAKETNCCPKCNAEVVSKCDCGTSFDLWYDYRGSGGKPISGRDYCLMCKRITPWAFSRFLSPDGSSQFGVYEEMLIDHLPHKPSPSSAGLTAVDLQGALGRKWYQRVFGVRIDITDARHPKHLLWLEYEALAAAFKSRVIVRWEADNARAQAIRDQRLTDEATWKALSGIQFEKQLVWFLARKGYQVEHVGGPGDSGADLILHSERGTIVIQCKAYSVKVGPAAVRELFGCLQHHDAREGWLVGVEGFTEAAQRFAKGKPVRLLTIGDLLSTSSHPLISKTSLRSQRSTI